jgi:hypothetical protein
MIIKYDSSIGKYKLIIDDEWYGSYQSVVAAADDVYCHVTGCTEWDILDGSIDSPTDIYQWTNLPG